jgi:transcriptional regulator of nitric oxide reductase
MSSSRLIRLGVATAMLIALATVPIATAASQAATAEGCAQQFEVAQGTDMESFRDYDEATFRDGHDPRAVTVFASGAVRYGIDAIMAALRPHFVNREAIWSWTELYRVVDGCKSAFILYDAVYEIPSTGYHQRTLTSVTYTHVGDRWLAIADQGTFLEPPSQ